ncbi:MAG: hypothetical protein PUG16_03385 [Lachnospiraceae bacterium]|nr:hypothetical protein [Lachnospiraceae bacterium]
MSWYNMENKGLDLEKLAILLKRRQNIVKEAISLTDEISEELNRQDIISANLLMEMRQDKLGQLEENWEEILLLGEESEEAGQEYQSLMGPKPEELRGLIERTDSEMKRIVLRERLEAGQMIRELQRKEEQLDLRSRTKLERSRT